MPAAPAPAPWLAAVADACLGLPGAALDHPFGPEHDVYRVGGKIFAIASVVETPWRLTAKAEPERVVELCERHAAITPGYHMSKRHWVTLDLAAPPPAGLLEELVEDAYDLVRAALPRAVRDGLPPV